MYLAVNKLESSGMVKVAEVADEEVELKEGGIVVDKIKKQSERDINSEQLPSFGYLNKITEICA